MQTLPLSDAHLSQPVPPVPAWTTLRPGADGRIHPGRPGRDPGAPPHSKRIGSTRRCRGLALMPSRGEGRTFEPRGPGPPAGRGRGHGSGASSASPTAPTAPPCFPLNSPKNQEIHVFSIISKHTPAPGRRMPSSARFPFHVPPAQRIVSHKERTEEPRKERKGLPPLHAFAFFVSPLCVLCVEKVLVRKLPGASLDLMRRMR